MIQDLSLTLRAILGDQSLRSTFPELVEAQVVFDRPADQFKPTQTTIDVFLYDIRENVELRSNEPEMERRNGRVISRRPALRVACSYLVTAWPVGGAEPEIQEHRLLSQVAQALSRYSTIPPEFLKGTLIGQEPPLPILTLAFDGLKNPAEFWSALGSRLRASLTVTVTIALEVLAPVTAPMVITETVRLEQRDLPATREEFVRIGGQVTGPGNAPVAGASVTLVERGLVASTGAEGRYTLGPIMSGTYTLRVQKDAAARQITITVPAAAGNNYDVSLV